MLSESRTLWMGIRCLWFRWGSGRMGRLPRWMGNEPARLEYRHFRRGENSPPDCSAAVICRPTVLILGRSLDMVDDQHLYGALRWYQLQAELLVYRGKEPRKIGIRVRGFVGGPLQGE